MGTYQEKAVVLYKHGLRNSAVHLKVVTLQLMTAFRPLSIEVTLSAYFSYIQPLIFFGNHFYL